MSPNLEQLLEDCDIFGGNHTSIAGNCSSRHNGPHELIPSLLV
jgi:hypothetical protein